MAAVSRPARRLRSKTPPPAQPQTTLVGHKLEAEADSKKGRSIYLVTLPHPKTAVSDQGRPLVAPETKTRKEILTIFLQCCDQPIYKDARGMAQQLPVPVEHTGVFRELHAEDAQSVAHAHDHLPVRAHRDFMFWPVKRALLERYGLASHWS